MILRLILLGLCFAISGVSRSELHQVPEGTDAVGMMALVYRGNQAFAAGIDAGLDWAAQKAATLGRTAAEAQELVQTVKKTGEVALTTMALTGLKKGVRAVKAPKPAIIKDALSERAVVKDGKVFLGDRELGPVSSMPTTRTFAKPLDAALREEFQSGVFDREVMFKGPGTGHDYRVYQRNDIDWDLVRTRGALEYVGKTNREAALAAGYAPELADGSVVSLHHVGQNAYGPLAEVTRKSHKATLHKQFGTNKPHAAFPVEHSVFEVDRLEYWKQRGA